MDDFLVIFILNLGVAWVLLAMRGVLLIMIIKCGQVVGLECVLVSTTTSKYVRMRRVQKTPCELQLSF